MEPGSCIARIGNEWYHALYTLPDVMSRDSGRKTKVGRAVCKYGCHDE